MSLTEIAAVVFALLAAGVVAFQLALAAGAPWGRFAMGGAFPGAFPPALRVAAVVQAIIVAALGAVVLADAGLIESPWVADRGWPIWVAVGFSAVAFFLNTITRSAGERRIWMPVTALMFASSLVVALTAA